MIPVELLQGYYVTLDTKRELEQLAYLEELREQQRAAERAAVAVTE
jgi:hypothetical protein